MSYAEIRQELDRMSRELAERYSLTLHISDSKGNVLVEKVTSPKYITTQSILEHMKKYHKGLHIAGYVLVNEKGRIIPWGDDADNEILTSDEVYRVRPQKRCAGCTISFGRKSRKVRKSKKRVKSVRRVRK